MPATKATTTKSYQQLRQELDELLLRLQNPDCDVDEAVQLYEQGQALAKKLQTLLSSAENKLTRLQGTTDATEAEQ